MVRVIKKGKLPEERMITTTCYNCQTEFEFTIGEARLVSDPRNCSFYQIPCPVCKKLANVDSKL